MITVGSSSANGRHAGLRESSSPSVGTVDLPPFPDREVVLFVDCDRRMHELRSELKQEGYRTLHPDEWDGLMDVMDHLPVGLVLVGSQRSDPHSLSTRIRSLEVQAPRAAILYLANDWEWGTVETGLQAGAHDVVPPPHTLASVLVRAEIVRSTRSKRGLSSSAGSRRFGDIEVDVQHREVWLNNRSSSLTGREFELIHALMDAAGTVVSREELLQSIWGPDQGSEAVLAATVHRLRRKLEANPSEPRRLTTVRGVGYRLES
ncbi:MAG: response regulator transcription factor [Gemmatimonadota bacterium]